MCSRKDVSGFTLIELVVAMVIIGVGLAGVMTAYNQVVLSSVNPLVRKQLLSVAEGMMEEVMLEQFAPAAGVIVGCNRAAADDVRDYDGYDQPVCDVDGNALAELNGYRVAVAVADDVLTGVAAAVAVPALRVTVTASSGADEMELTGWRTDIGQ